jgi:hypothetical protein
MSCAAAQLAGIGTEARHTERSTAGSRVGAAVGHVGRCTARSCLSACTWDEGSRPVRAGLHSRTGNGRACTIGSSLSACTWDEGSRPVGAGLHACTWGSCTSAFGSCNRARTGGGRSRAVRSSGGTRRRTFNPTRRCRVGTGDRGEGQSRRSCAGDQNSSHEFFSHSGRVPLVNLLETSDQETETATAAQVVLGARR